MTCLICKEDKHYDNFIGSEAVGICNECMKKIHGSGAEYLNPITPPQPAPTPQPAPEPAPLNSVDARYFDLLHRLGCCSHDGAIQEIANLRRADGLEKSGTIPTPPPARQPTCSSCRFWEAPEPRTLGFCLRFPPHPRLGHPLTNSPNWCGEHRERKEA